MSIEYLSFGNKDRKEFWFMIPSNTAKKIYDVLLNWLPDKYRMDMTTSEIDNTGSLILLDPIRPEQRCVILNPAPGGCLCSCFGHLSINSEKEWELAPILELRLQICSDKLVSIKPSLSEGVESSQILSSSMVMQLVSILPARAQRYSWIWIKCYDSLKKGSLLATLYRDIKNELRLLDQEWELAPIQELGTQIRGAKGNQREAMQPCGRQGVHPAFNPSIKSRNTRLSNPPKKRTQSETRVTVKSRPGRKDLPALRVCYCVTCYAYCLSSNPNLINICRCHNPIHQTRSVTQAKGIALGTTQDRPIGFVKSSTAHRSFHFIEIRFIDIQYTRIIHVLPGTPLMI